MNAILPKRIPPRLSLAQLLFLAIVLSFFAGCGTPVVVQYQSPKYGSGSVSFTLPKKGGYAK